MPKLLSEEDYQYFKQVENNDVVEFKTRDGENYFVSIVDRDGTVVTAAYNKTPDDLYLIELRGGRGRGGDEEQPYIALGFDQNNALEVAEPKEEREGDVFIGGTGPVEVHKEEADIEYTTEIIEFGPIELPEDF